MCSYGTWFDFDNNGKLEVQDDPTLHDYNVDLFIDQFVQDALLQVCEVYICSLRF